MSLNVDSFIKNYPYEPGVKGINFEPLKSGSLIPRPYFGEGGSRILITMMEDKVEITPNNVWGAVRLLGEMKDNTTLKLEYRTRPYEGGEPYPDLYAKYFVISVLGYLENNGHTVKNIFEEYN